MSVDEIKTGTIKKKFEKGYGFIQEEDSEKDMFFHAREVVDPGFEKLRIGISVNYLIGKSKKGPEAISIVAIPDKQ
jgi:cold shock CspA family protein